MASQICQQLTTKTSQVILQLMISYMSDKGDQILKC